MMALVAAQRFAGKRKKRKASDDARAGAAKSQRARIRLAYPNADSRRLRLGELLETDDLVASESDKDSLRGRGAVDPVFGFVSVGVTLADFVVGTAHGGNYHFVVHADGGVSVLDGLLVLRGQRIHPLDSGGALL